MVTRPMFERLELDVMHCSDPVGKPSYRVELPKTGDMGPNFTLPIVPGEPFFLWLKGYRPCAPGQACTSSDNPSGPDTCWCFPDQETKAQVIERQACTGWVRAEKKASLPLSLGAVDDRCPPAPMDCDS